MVYKPYRCQRQDGLSRPANSSWSRPECGFGPEPSARREAERRNAQTAPMLTRARDARGFGYARGDGSMRASSRISGAIAAGFVSATVLAGDSRPGADTTRVVVTRGARDEPRARDENTRRNARNARLWCGYAQTRSNIPGASAGESVGKLLRRHAFRSARSRPASRGYARSTRPTQETHRP